MENGNVLCWGFCILSIRPSPYGLPCSSPGSAVPSFEVSKACYYPSSPGRVRGRHFSADSRLHVYPQKCKNCHVQTLHKLSEGQQYLLLNSLQQLETHWSQLLCLWFSFGPGQAIHIPIAFNHFGGGWYLEDNVEIPPGIQALKHLPCTQQSLT